MISDEEYEKLNRMFTQQQWELMERIQEEEPHLFFGWYGFIPMVVQAEHC